MAHRGSFWFWDEKAVAAVEAAGLNVVAGKNIELQDGYIRAYRSHDVGSPIYGVQRSVGSLFRCLLDAVDKFEIDKDGNITLGGPFDPTNELSAENTEPVTVTDAPTPIVTLDLGEVTAGDRIFLAGSSYGGKGATDGMILVEARKSSGTATIQFLKDLIWLYVSAFCPASYPYAFELSGILKITGSGTLVMMLQGDSDGSDYSIAAGAGQIYAVFLRKQ